MPYETVNVVRNSAEDLITYLADQRERFKQHSCRHISSASEGALGKKF